MFSRRGSGVDGCGPDERRVGDVIGSRLGPWRAAISGGHAGYATAAELRIATESRKIGGKYHHVAGNAAQ